MQLELESLATVMRQTEDADMFQEVQHEVHCPASASYWLCCPGHKMASRSFEKKLPIHSSYKEKSSSLSTTTVTVLLPICVKNQNLGHPRRRRIA